MLLKSHVIIPNWNILLSPSQWFTVAELQAGFWKCSFVACKVADGWLVTSLFLHFKFQGHCLYPAIFLNTAFYFFLSAPCRLEITYGLELSSEKVNVSVTSHFFDFRKSLLLSINKVRHEECSMVEIQLRTNKINYTWHTFDGIRRICLLKDLKHTLEDISHMFSCSHRDTLINPLHRSSAWLQIFLPV